MSFLFALVKEEFLLDWLPAQKSIFLMKTLVGGLKQLMLKEYELECRGLSLLRGAFLAVYQYQESNRVQKLVIVSAIALPSRKVLLKLLMEEIKPLVMKKCVVGYRDVFI